MLPLAAMLAVASCGSAGSGIECAGWRPILMSRDDLLTEETERLILAHNEFGVARACWKAPG